MIREATPADAATIGSLLGELGYEASTELVEERLRGLLSSVDDDVLVDEADGLVRAFIAVHYFRQLPLAGDFARVTYFCVASSYRSQGVGRKLEEACFRRAIARGCDRIEVHCHARRTAAHRFYQSRGYVEAPKYFLKMLPPPG